MQYLVNTMTRKWSKSVKTLFLVILCTSYGEYTKLTKLNMNEFVAKSIRPFCTIKIYAISEQSNQPKP